MMSSQQSVSTVRSGTSNRTSGRSVAVVSQGSESQRRARNNEDAAEDHPAENPDQNGERTELIPFPRKFFSD